MEAYMLNNQTYLEFFDDTNVVNNSNNKICIYCNIAKNLDEFPKHRHYKDNLDNRCRECIKNHAKIRNELRKTAPEKSEICECCKKTTDKIVLDHNHSDNTFRGWLCDKCNTGIGKLGDDVEGLIKALNYLLSRK
ncbi:MAG: hypothetical protein EBU90_03640 [Proteobacteria bacterium]|nr:hypothetical protein [Pseudomonadota bacterium]NBP13682.1 hypothetical protein [bacterium]